MKSLCQLLNSAVFSIDNTEEGCIYVPISFIYTNSLLTGPMGCSQPNLDLIDMKETVAISSKSRLQMKTTTMKPMNSFSEKPSY